MARTRSIARALRKHPIAPFIVVIALIIGAALAAGEFGGRRDQAALPSDPLYPLAQEVLNGTPAERIILLEYFDLDCPFCRGYDQDGEPALMEKYAGKPVAFAYRHLPLSYHTTARIKAEALECAAAQKPEERKKVMSALYLHSFAGTSTLARAVAAASGLSASSIETCLTSGAVRETVARAAQKAAAHGASRTPTFIMYKDGVERGRVVGYRMRQIEATIDLLLAEDGQTKL